MLQISNYQFKNTRLIHFFLLGLILLLAIFLNFYRLEAEGYANLYYAAGVKSMLSSWHNFFFVSFDPGGFVTIDKPPLGLWIQTVSSMILGFDGWSLLMPQATAGVLSVALLYYLVARIFGPTAGLVAALVLTLTPISVAANRNNTMDSLLVFTSLLAAFFISKAVEKGSLQWLLLSAFFVGIGFNIKMLQAFLVLPAFFLLYLFTASLSWWKKLSHLFFSSLLLIIVALSWAIVVDRTPSDQRPYIGSSNHNSVMELIIGYNGIERLGGLFQFFTKHPEPPTHSITPTHTAPIKGQLSPQNHPPMHIIRNEEIGVPGIFRLLNKQLAGQITWFLPFSFLGFIVAWWTCKGNKPISPKYQAILMWGFWLAPQVILFSIAGMFHRYYLGMMAPAIAALTGIGFILLYQRFIEFIHDEKKTSLKANLISAIQGRILLLTFMITAFVELIIILPFPNWRTWLIPILLCPFGISLLGLSLVWLVAIISKISQKQNLKNFSQTKIPTQLAFCCSTLGLFAMLIPVTIWSLTPIIYGGDKGLPFAGPDLQTGISVNEIPDWTRLTDYLSTHRTTEKYLLGTDNAQNASPFILTTGDPIMAMGGFTGNDPILTAEEIKQKVEEKEIRFFLLPGELNNNFQNQTQKKHPLQTNILEAQKWVQNNCDMVPTRDWYPGTLPTNHQLATKLEMNPILWDCSRENKNYE